MKIIKEILIILGIYYSGLLISDLISGFFFIPGNIIGMGMLFLLLNTGIVKIEHIKHTSGFLLKHMGFFFIPLGAAFYVLFDVIRPVWVQIFVVLIVSSVFVMAVSGKIVELFIISEDKKEAS
ncbi:MAG: Putative effector of murein hydrolase LrgA [Clostridiales bacterium 38_11]|nr:MAG: Putative effector of murein hydrolase LrgA [Clostridiales bacterium 38_11]HBH12019.1 CidA/LrgA family protein [Clostridiales bacterium]